LRFAIRRPKLAAPALSWTGRHWAVALWHEGSVGVHAPAGSPTVGPEQSPPPLLDEDPLLDADELLLLLLLAEEAPPLPVPTEAEDGASPPAPPAEEVEVEVEVEAADEVDPPLPPPLEDEQPARARVGARRVKRRAKEDGLFIPGAWMHSADLAACLAL
jgi:hypothetical protein